MNDNDNELMTLSQISREFGLGDSTLRRLCAPTGDLPCIRLSLGPTAKRRTRGAIRVRRGDWLAWLAAHRQEPPARKPTPAATDAAARRMALEELPGWNRYGAGDVQ